MKRIVKILGLILVSGIMFTSCGSDDDDPWVPDQKIITYVYSNTLQGIKNNEITNILDDLTLKDILASEGIDDKNFISAEMQNSGSYFEIEGLKNLESQPSLRNIVFRVGAKSGINLGTCSPNPSGLNEFPSDQMQSSNKDLELVHSIFKDVTGRNKKAEMRITFIPSENIIGDDVKIKISIRATYRYKLYEK